MYFYHNLVQMWLHQSPFKSALNLQIPLQSPSVLLNPHGPWSHGRGARAPGLISADHGGALSSHRAAGEGADGGGTRHAWGAQGRDGRWERKCLVISCLWSYHIYIYIYTCIYIHTFSGCNGYYHGFHIGA